MIIQITYNCSSLEQWKYEPFSAHKDEKGDIYGRGTQDMKSVGMQYLEAVDRMRKQGKTFKRTIHLSFVPGMLLNIHDKSLPSVCQLSCQLFHSCYRIQDQYTKLKISKMCLLSNDSQNLCLL